jgi:hypothetical protein
MHTMHVETPGHLGRDSQGARKVHEGCARDAGSERSSTRVLTLKTTGVWRRVLEENDLTLEYQECQPYTSRSGVQPILVHWTED